MADLITMLSAVAGQQGEEVDEDFNQTVLLLHGDGTNGAQNNTFLDGSTNNFTITRNGNTTQGTFSPFSLAAGEWSNYFDGSGDYLTVPDNAAFDLGSGNWTVETWVYLNALPATNSYYNVLAQWGPTGVGNDLAYNFLIFNDAGTIKLRNEWSTTGSNAFSSSVAASITTNAWHHIAWVRDGNNLKTFFNGTEVTSGASISVTIFNSSRPINIGRNEAADVSLFNGYMSNLRLVKGTAVYTSNFTPPTAPLTAITNTSLLTCQSNRFVDNSSNAFAITRNGDVRVTPFSPFAPTAAYSAGTNGGSGYFDGSGDYLTVPNNVALQLGGGDFTIECWVNGASQNSKIILSKRNSASSHEWLLYTNANGFIDFAYNIGQAGVASTILLNNSWQHIAVVRASGTITMYINGVSAGSSGTALNNSTNNIGIGAGSGGDSPFLGYIANVRLVKGTAVYTSNFTPPTAPPTAITNTSLLCNFTNAGIFDNTGKNVLETVADAQIDTTTKKFGTGSLEFDGTGDWLLMPNNPDQQLGTGNFTIEFWVYLATGDTGSARGLVAKGTSTTGFLVSLDSSQKVVFTFTTSTITSSGAITLDAWNHIAVVREGTGSNQTKIYIGGTNDGTGTVSTDFNQTSVMYVGANRTGGDPMKGFIDDLRITKGIARYTANFTAPTKALPDQ